MLQARSWLPRTEGSVGIELACRDGQTVLATLHQAGAARARFPRRRAGPLEAVLLNTAGGLTGGDRIDLQVRLAAGAQATVTTAAAEKIYRASEEDETEISVRLALDTRSRLAWLPQPTILFDRSRLNRRCFVELSGDATFLAVETLIFGRMAMGEDVRQGACRDAWRVRRDGALVFADTFRANGPVADMLDRPATLDGARAVAMLLYIAPDADIRIDKARMLLDSPGMSAGASTWEGILLVRAMARDGHTLQRQIAPLAEWLSGHPLPQVWQC